MKHLCKSLIGATVILLSACNQPASAPAAAGGATTGTADTITIPPVAEDPDVSKDTKAFLQALNSGGGAPLETLSPEAARKVLVGAQASAKVDYSGIDESEKTIVADSHTIKLNIVRPAGARGILPVFIFIHGGGWVLGDYPTHRRLVRDLVVASGAAAVFVNYTPSPEAHYPQAVNEIYAATKWVAEHGSEIQVDGKRLAVAGNSVGGNMTAVTALKAIENHGPAIKALVMFWPIVDAKFDHDSYKRYGKDRFLTSPLMQWMYDQYTKDSSQRQEIYASPINASADLLRQFPPTLIQVADADILRDGGEAFGRKLDAAGATVTTIRYNGAIHDFGLLNALATTPQTKSLILQAGAELKKYLFR